VERCTLVLLTDPDGDPRPRRPCPVLIVRTSRPRDRTALAGAAQESGGFIFHFVDARTFLFGPSRGLNRCLGGKKGGKTGPLAAVLSSAEEHDVAAWGRAIPAGSPTPNRPPSQPEPVRVCVMPTVLPPGVEWVAATLDVDRDTRLAVRLSCRTEALAGE